MSAHQVSATSHGQTLNVVLEDVKRRSANHSPSAWGDYFISYASLETDTKLEKEVQELKEKVKRMVMAPSMSSEKLNLINNVQQLGVSRHFENEIEEVLLQIHKSYYEGDGQENDDDLYTTALRFRLLRQQGFKVSCDMFNKFKDVDGKFKESLATDAVGLLSLFETTHVRVHGEDLLDEALTFTTTHLESSIEAHRLSPLLSKQVTHALYQPFWKGFPRLEARSHLSIYEEHGHLVNQTLLTFAKLDFNLLQQVHQKELSEITRLTLIASTSHIHATRKRTKITLVLWLFSCNDMSVLAIANVNVCE